jgi:hypothetical protein
MIELNQILTEAQKHGQQRQEARVEKAREFFKGVGERVQQAKQGARETWTSIHGTVAKVGNGILTAETFIREPNMRAEVRGWARERVEDAADKTIERIDGVKEQFNDKKDELVENAHKQWREVKKTVNKELIQPSVAKAKEIGDAVVTGVETAGFYGAVLTLGAIYGAETLVDKTREQITSGKEKAREWKNRFTAFTSRQGERVWRDIQIGSHEIYAAWNDVLAKPQELERDIETHLANVVASKLTTRAAEKNRLAQKRRERAIEHRNFNQSLRAV